MISLDGQVVGAIWVDLKPNHETNAPAISLMIGQPTARGKGVGEAAVRAVMRFLKSEGHLRAYARHLIENTASAALFAKLGFVKAGTNYLGEDGLRWQNMEYAW